MSEKNDGGNAFPYVETGEFGQTRFVCPGLSIRDYFAAEAMKGILSNPNMVDNMNVIAIAFATDRSYDVADAMLEKRKND